MRLTFFFFQKNYFFKASFSFISELINFLTSYSQQVNGARLKLKISTKKLSKAL